MNNIDYFQKKSFADLKNMEKEIVDRIKGHSRGIDVSFWEEVLDLLRPKMARTRLKELHAKKMKMRLEQIRAEQKKATQTHEKDHIVSIPSTSSSSRPADNLIKDEPAMEVDIKPRIDNKLNVSTFLNKTYNQIIF